MQQVPGYATSYRRELLPDVQPQPSWIKSISRYPDLAANKAKVRAAMQAEDIPPAHQALMIAMAMIESDDMCVDERDATKDCRTDGAANVTLFNLSVDLVQMTGYFGPNKALTTQQCQLLNSPCQEGLNDAVGIIETGVGKWGVPRLLAFVRNGRDGFDNQNSPDVADYWTTVATILDRIDQDPALMGDDRRVEIQLKHI